ncbi:MAG: NifU family protein [Candidatus Margulisiibacteriota bacterium]|jgi:Fe-S cluster biogenesis protein NfuA
MTEENTLDLNERIQTILETEIRPILNMDGGDVEFLAYEDGIVKVHLKGACNGCPGAVMTLKYGIENRLKEEISEIKEVIAI